MQAPTPYGRSVALYAALVLLAASGCKGGTAPSADPEVGDIYELKGVGDRTQVHSVGPCADIKGCAMQAYEAVYRLASGDSLRVHGTEEERRLVHAVTSEGTPLPFFVDADTLGACVGVEERAMVGRLHLWVVAIHSRASFDESFEAVPLPPSSPAHPPADTPLQP